MLLESGQRFLHRAQYLRAFGFGTGAACAPLLLGNSLFRFRDMPIGFRQVFYYADTARALAQTRGRDREAIRFLLTAERIAPQHLHASPLAQETTRSLLDRSGGAQLRGLCERLGVL